MSDVQRYTRYRYFRTDINGGDSERIVGWDDFPAGVGWDDVPDGITWADAFAYTTVLRSNMGNIEVGTGKAHFCNVCQTEYRESELVLWRGLWWCKPRGHHRDIGSILLVETTEGFTPDSSREEGYDDLIITEAE